MEGYRELNIGEAIEVNDVIVENNALKMTKQWTVYKISEKYCYIKLNDKASRKYPIKYAKVFQTLPAIKFNTNWAKAYRLVVK